MSYRPCNFDFSKRLDQLDHQRSVMRVIRIAVLIGVMLLLILSSRLS